MKKILFLLMCIPLVTFTGCSDDEENNSIVGKWECVADYEKVNGSWEKVYEYDREENIWEISDNKIIVYYENQMNGRLPYTLDGTTINIDGYTSTVSISGNNMEIYDDEDKMTLRRLN